MNKTENINFNIKQIEMILDDIFDSYSNDDFEFVDSTVFVYKDVIRFVPSSIGKQVEALLALIDMMNENKTKVLNRTK